MEIMLLGFGQCSLMNYVVICILQDGLIPPENVAYHARAFEAANVKFSLQTFDYGHLEFTFGTRGEVVSFVMRRLRKSLYE